MKKAFLIIMFLILGSGCATTTQKLPWEGKLVAPRTGEFDKRTGVYKNNEVGFTLWFPTGYEICTDESEIKQWAKKEGNPNAIVLLLGANERESIFVIILATITPMSLGDYVYLAKTSALITEVSSQEKQVGGIKYVEMVYSGPQKDATTGKEVDFTTYHNILDMKGYKVSILFSTITQSLNQRRIDEIKEIMNSFKKF